MQLHLAPVRASLSCPACRQRHRRGTAPVVCTGYCSSCRRLLWPVFLAQAKWRHADVRPHRRIQIGFEQVQANRTTVHTGAQDLGAIGVIDVEQQPHEIGNRRRRDDYGGALTMLIRTGQAQVAGASPSRVHRAPRPRIKNTSAAASARLEVDSYPGRCCYRGLGMAHKKRDQPGIAVLAIADTLYTKHLKRLASHPDAERIKMLPVRRAQRTAKFQTTRLRREKSTSVEKIQE
ncbi:hypothetical protein ALQ25_200105 [Pseudomonas coronafaciens pv. atropurpurea]|nr:hypothetical protein ALQ25_200105 [Pseudomonas coronafaciens pv. atropurpurea]